MTQNDWRLCHKCQGLYFAGSAKSVCPAKGKHQNTGSMNYLLADSALPIPVAVTLSGYDEDTAVSILCDGGGNYGLNVVSKGAGADDVNPVGVYAETDGLGTSVWAVAEGGNGLIASSKQGRGVVGHSVNSDGVQGKSDQGVGVFGEGPGYGVHGKSNAGSAVYGEQTGGGDGVTGRSANGTGVAGISSHANGIYGRCDDREVGNAGYFEGNVVVTGDISLGNADCAEEFVVLNGANGEPGTVMVLAEGGGVTESDRSYDTRVAGVVSGAGGLGPGIIMGRGAAAANRTSLALMGKVYCKVDAAYGVIAIGDLLTTSGTPGHAMRVSDRTQAFGAVIGKALESLEQGTGVIPVLVGLR